uniref:glycogen debranching protein GlgX n=1 Tax=Paenirhodobacter enshiensis TaxID=1105367 RepID=UPI0035AE1FF8
MGALGGGLCRALRGPDRVISTGESTRLGAIPRDGGTNFALFSAGAERVDLCLFTESGETVLTLPERSGDIWHGFVPGIGEGARYGYRVHGPWAPAQGQRFNPAKLLIDPYARALDAPIRWHVLMQGGTGPIPDVRDSAEVVPKAIVCADRRIDWARPQVPLSETVVYEAHPRGLTMLHPEVPEALRGRFEALASEPVIAHLRALGVTALELLPCAAFIDDQFLLEKGLTNYWGYQPVGFFAPDPRYGGPEAFRTMVAGLHAAGIEVLVDIVLNHTGEGDDTGPSLSLRGIDNASYYRLSGPGRSCIDDTGTGNTIDLSHPMVLRMATDCLRHWVCDLGVDGFRFDLAATLGRDSAGRFGPDAAFLSALRQDPALASVKLFAEPWDVGPGGYQLGGFPWPFSEWNDRYRDGVRRFWKREPGMTAELARRIAGSAEIFDRAGRSASASLNFITAHDGFTLHDLVSYAEKNNAANGENNRDGHSANYSEALPTEEERAARKRAMLATLLISQGVPMILAGDEIGNSQKGNNNAYAQDNEIGWTDWREADLGLMRFVARLVALRKAHPVLRQRRFLHARVRRQDGVRDLIWRLPSGTEPSLQDWTDPSLDCIGLEIRGAAEGPDGEAAREAVFVVLNTGPGKTVQLPAGAWRLLLDTAHPDAQETACEGDSSCVSAQSVQLFARPTVAAAGATQERS